MTHIFLKMTSFIKLSLGSQRVKSSYGLLLGESLSDLRTMFGHTLMADGQQLREHDDPVNNKGDATQVNLILQTRRDVIKGVYIQRRENLNWQR